jgi:surface carbohydrate biosynthesis protein (TIGR04326 family)
LSFKNRLKNDVLHIWDSKNTAPEGDWTSVLWSQHADKNNPRQVSIVEVVEKNSDELRKRYLTWIYDLGESKIDGQRIIDHLSIRSEFSYWWTTSLAQKFNCSGKSQINNSIKALALESLFAEVNIKSVVLHSENIILARVISSFCLKKNINFEFYKIKPIQKISPSKLLFELLPGTIIALIYLLRYVFRTAPLYFINRFNTFKNIGDVMFFDVLVHLDKQAFEDGRFHSNYWTSLVDKLKEVGIKSNWTHLFFKHSLVPSIISANQLTKKFTLSSSGTEFHNLLERPLTIIMIIEVISDFFKIRSLLKKTNGIANISPIDSDMNLWPFHEVDWKKSLCGKESIDICIKLSCFNSILANIPRQRVGIYIAENQPWEMALIYTWKLYGHGKLIGTPHTTIRYWDLRYFYDVRTYNIKQKNDMPMPDILAVNGLVAKKTMLSSFYPIQKLVEVEALRFLYLNKFNKLLKRSKRNDKLRVLICCDFNAETNQTIMKWIEIVSQLIPNEVSLIVKPHPAYQLNYNSFLKIEISNKSLPELFAQSNVVFTSNISSIAVDAFCFGIPVIQMLDGNNFNTSPLKDLGASYARTPKELADLILTSYPSRVSTTSSPYFNLDADISAWLKLIDI